MADPSPLHAITVVWEPGHHAHPVRVVELDVDGHKLTPADVIGLLRAAAMGHAAATGTNGRDALDQFLTHITGRKEDAA